MSTKVYTNGDYKKCLLMVITDGVYEECLRKCIRMVITKSIYSSYAPSIPSSILWEWLRLIGRDLKWDLVLLLLLLGWYSGSGVAK